MTTQLKDLTRLIHEMSIAHRPNLSPSASTSASSISAGPTPNIGSIHKLEYFQKANFQKNNIIGYVFAVKKLRFFGPEQKMIDWAPTIEKMLKWAISIQFTFDNMRRRSQEQLFFKFFTPKTYRMKIDISPKPLEWLSEVSGALWCTYAKLRQFRELVTRYSIADMATPRQMIKITLIFIFFFSKTSGWSL